MKNPKLKEQQRRASLKYYNKNKEALRAKRNIDDGFYSVYYIPEHHYVGMTNDMKKRTNNHKYNYKRDVSNIRVLKTFDCPYKAHLYESQWHVMGANGSHLRYNNLKNK